MLSFIEETSDFLVGTLQVYSTHEPLKALSDLFFSYPETMSIISDR